MIIKYYTTTRARTLAPTTISPPFPPQIQMTRWEGNAWWGGDTWRGGDAWWGGDATGGTHDKGATRGKRWRAREGRRSEEHGEGDTSAGWRMVEAGCDRGTRQVRRVRREAVRATRCVAKAARQRRRSEGNARQRGRGSYTCGREGTDRNGNKKEEKMHQRREKKGDNPLSWFASERGVLCTCRGGQMSAGMRGEKERNAHACC